MPMKGHKKGCRCVGCSAATRKKGMKALKKTRKRNHGNENQMKNLVRAERSKPLTRLNPKVDSVTISVQRDNPKVGNVSITVKKWPSDPERWTWTIRGKSGATLPGGDVKAGTKKEAEKKAVAAYKRRRREMGLDNPAPRKVKRNSSVRIDDESLGIAGNPTHFPRTARGRKPNTGWFIFDLYDSQGNTIVSSIERTNGTDARFAARNLVNKRHDGRNVKKVQLSGPYVRKPTAKTTRK